MSQERCWGDGNVLSATALLYNHAINVYVPDHEKFTIGNDDLTAPCLNIGFVYGNHYVSLENTACPTIETVYLDDSRPNSFPSTAPAGCFGSVELESESIDIVPSIEESFGIDEKFESMSSINDGSTQPAKIETATDACDDVRLLPNQPRNITFPTRKIGQKNRCFRSNWFDSYQWLEWDSSVNAAFCHRCRMACKLNLLTFSHSYEDAFTRTGFTNWKKAIDAFNQHEKIFCSQGSTAQMVWLLELA